MVALSIQFFVGFVCVYTVLVYSQAPPPNILNKPTVCDNSRPLTKEEAILLKNAQAKAEEEEADAKDKEAIYYTGGASKGTADAKLDSLHATSQDKQEKGRDAAKCSKIAAYIPKASTDVISLKGTAIGNSTCFAIPDCTDYENATFRTIDGRCNNLMNGLAGMAGTPSVRLVPAAYAKLDGRSDVPRYKGESHQRLKSAKTISWKVLRSAEVFDNQMSIMGMQWGQFLDHDITKTPVFQIVGERIKFSNIECCIGNRVKKFKKNRHPECFPIEISKKDEFRKKYKVGCMNFVRSLPAPDINCILSTRQQMNSISHFIDASNVYGSSDKELSTLRDGRRLKTQVGNLLPAAEDTKECPVVNGQHCFLAGDGRVNEQTGLVVMHTLWMREHNRISDFIANNGANCTDEEIFQTARRIVGAEMQHITYNEYLRAILGEDYLVAHELAPETNIDGSYPYFPKYNSTIDPSISNAFNTAAYRFGHSMIRGFVEFHSENGLEEGRYLRTQFFAPYDIYNKTFRSNLGRGLGRSVCQRPDEAFSPEMTDHLFQGKHDIIGLDVRALNIQRGRDHGLPPYNKFRKLCNLNKIRSFNEFTGEGFEQPLTVKQALIEVYESVNDIDLFVGGSLEKPVTGTALGPTFLCIIGDQFQRLKIGDRYFYDNNAQPNPFTEKQLLEIKNKLSLASVMCLNRDEEELTMQKEIFKSPTASSGLVHCDEIPAVDLSVFLSG